MRVKVLLGTVRADDREYKTGEIAELSESDAKPMIREGVVEEVKEKKPKKAVKEEPKPEPESEPEVEQAVEAEISLEPSLDWTKKELDEYARKHGIEEPEKLDSKQKVLNALAKGGEKE